MLKKTIKYHILKTIYSILGFFKSRTFRKDDVWLIQNEAAVYHGKGIWYITHQVMEPTTGTIFYSTENKKFKYWQITALDFKKQ